MEVDRISRKHNFYKFAEGDLELAEQYVTCLKSGDRVYDGGIYILNSHSMQMFHLDKQVYQ